jgi:hypothetical protein
MSKPPQRQAHKLSVQASQLQEPLVGLVGLKKGSNQHDLAVLAVLELLNHNISHSWENKLED